MAIRALVSAKDYEVISNTEIALTWHVLFYGPELPAPDATRCQVIINPTQPKGTNMLAIRQAITAAAAELGYPYNGNALHIDELFIGL